MTTPWQPYREPLRTTLLRTITIAVIAGLLLARFRFGMSHWPMAILLVLWPSFGGHWVDLFFLNWLRPRIPAGRGAQIAARLATWFVGGTALALGMALTAMALAGFGTEQWPAWWFGGAGFIAVELVAQLVLQLRGLPSFFNGRG